MDDFICPLCAGVDTTFYYRDRVRDYINCQLCDLIFVPLDQHLSSADEKSYYDLHENQVDDQGYRRFLSRLFDPLNECLKKPSNGLDFGCGPGPALAEMFVEAGHSMWVYDPYYAPETSALSVPYDFITLSEVAEHLAHPLVELERLWNLLKSGGVLGIMTKRVRNKEAFASWHYITDPTHICFFSEVTFQWLENRWRGSSLEIISDDVVVFKKA